MIEKAREVKTAEKLLEIAKANGVEMTADEAKTYFEQFNANSLDDDLLEGVAGGWIIFASEESESSTQEYKRGGKRKGRCET